MPFNEVQEELLLLDLDDLVTQVLASGLDRLGKTIKHSGEQVLQFLEEIEFSSGLSRYPSFRSASLNAISASDCSVVWKMIVSMCGRTPTV
jgi:hypothetical protein